MILLTNFKKINIYLVSLFFSLVFILAYIEYFRRISYLIYIAISLVFIIIHLKMNFKISKKHFLLLFIYLIFFLKNLILIQTSEYSFSDPFMTFARIYVIVTAIIIFNVLIKTNIFDEVIDFTIKLIFYFGIFSYMYYEISGEYLVNENIIGFFLVIYFIKRIYELDKLIFKVIFYILGVIILYFTEARSVLFSFLTFPIFMYILQFFKKKKIIYLLLIVFLLLITLFLGIYNNYFLANLSSNRTTIWNSHINSFIKKPILGYGPINETKITKINKNLNLNEAYKKVGSHNSFLMILLKDGILGFVSYLLIIYLLINNNLKNHYYFALIYILIIFQSLEVSLLGGVSYASYLFLLVLLRTSYFKKPS